MLARFQSSHYGSILVALLSSIAPFFCIFCSNLGGFITRIYFVKFQSATTSRRFLGSIKAIIVFVENFYLQFTIVEKIALKIVDLIHLCKLSIKAFTKCYSFISYPPWLQIVVK